MAQSEALRLRLQEEIESRNLRQEDVSALTGIPQSTISRHLTGRIRRRWHPQIIARFAYGLNLPFDRLMILAGWPSPSEADQVIDPIERIAELAKEIPWIQDAVEDLLQLDPAERETVLALVQTILARRT